MSEAEWWQLHQKLPKLEARHNIIQSVRAWFSERGFLEVETPIVVPSPGVEVHLKALSTEVCGHRRYLITSPEYQMKRLIAAGASNIYYLGKVFRDDEKGIHHLPEFTMLEWYRVGGTPEDLMNDVKALVSLATKQPNRTWTAISVGDALARWGTPSDDPDNIVQQLVEHVEPELSKLGAVFLTDYPASMASLARLNPDNPKLSERFEAYVDGIELANGFGELTDAAEQRERCNADLAQRQSMGLPAYPIDESFLGALQRGMPETSGIALGLDRLIMIALGAKSIDEVVAFPPQID